MSTAQHRVKLTPVPTDTTPTREERRARVAAHTETLRALLEAKLVSEVPQRIFRARIWRGEEYLVVTLTQNHNMQAPPGAMIPKVQCFVTRSYEHAQATGASVAQLALYGQYAVDEIVAFLRLDTLDPSEVEWQDETHYSKIIIAGDILHQNHGARHGRGQD